MQIYSKISFKLLDVTDSKPLVYHRIHRKKHKIFQVIRKSYQEQITGYQQGYQHFSLFTDSQGPDVDATFKKLADTA